MALMNVYDKLVMGPTAGNQEGQVPRRYFKHIGELADTSKAKVVIVYRTVPDEPNNCLVVGTKFLPDMYHNALMRAQKVAKQKTNLAYILEDKHFQTELICWLYYIMTIILKNFQQKILL
jgi:hypothetical protein